MICTDCRRDRHDRCPGGTWCDCQHRRKTYPPRSYGPDVTQQAESMPTSKTTPPPAHED